MFCNQCGHRNPSGSNFCSSCGAALGSGSDETTLTLAAVEEHRAEADDDIAVTVDDLPEGMGMLVVRKGPNAGSRYLLDAEVTHAGRHPNSDIFLDDITVSRRHAEVVKRGNGYFVRDVGSLNGTYVNRDRVDEVALNSGDELQIGKFRLVFVTGPRS
jgi:pSer/pThr/pTyr-binding forkhead associated (FHA) protein